MTGQDYSAPAVDAAARILRLLSRYKHQASTLTEIAIDLKLNKSTCLRVLETLRKHQLVHLDTQSRRYSLGIFTVVLGYRAQETLDYLVQLRPFLSELAVETGLTAMLVQQVSDDRLMYVAKEESTSHVHVTISVGNQFPILEVSYGKWFLAYLGEEAREAYLDQGLPRVTPMTCTSVTEYRRQLDVIRQNEVMVSQQEYISGIDAVSAPVVDHHGDLLGVIGVLGMSSTLDQPRIASIAALVREVARKATAMLQGELEVPVESR